MSDSSEARDELLRRIKELEAEYWVAVEFTKRDDTGKASESAQKVADGVLKILDQIAKNYSPSMQKSYLADFSEVSARLREEGQNLSSDLKRIGQYVALATSEFNRIYPKDSFATKFINAHRKKIVGAGAAVFLVLCLWGLYVSRKPKHGLLGEYFSDAGFRKFYKKQIDPQIDFRWGGGLGYPINRSKISDYSIRWTGFILIPENGNYEFITHSDDGVRLRIDDDVIIDNWTCHWVAEDRGARFLQAGSHKISLEYFQRNFDATIQLFWRPKQSAVPYIVPSEYLVPSLNEIE